MSVDLQNEVFIPEDVAAHKGHALCAYLHTFCGLPLFLVPLLAAPNSPFARFHANQGLIHYLVALGGSIVLYFTIFILVGFLLLPLFGIFCFILGVMGIINSANGQARRLPIIGRWTIIGPLNPPKDSI